KPRASPLTEALSATGARPNDNRPGPGLRCSLCLAADAEELPDTRDFVVNRSGHGKAFGRRYFREMSFDIVGGRIAARPGEPALAETDEGPGVATRARGVVVVRNGTGPARQEDNHRHHQFGFDGFEELGYLRNLFPLTYGGGDHPRIARREYGVGADAVLRSLDREHVGQPDGPGLRRGIVRSFGRPEDPRRRGDEHESAVAL